MKKITILIILMFLTGFLNLNLMSDDKELFMGVNAGASAIKPNVMFLLDSSGSMNAVVAYPQKGLDGQLGTADDGFDMNATYSGTLANDFSSIYSGRHHAAFVYDSADTDFVRYVGPGRAYLRVREITDAGGGYIWIRLRYYSNRRHFKVGTWIQDRYWELRAPSDDRDATKNAIGQIEEVNDTGSRYYIKVRDTDVNGNSFTSHTTYTSGYSIYAYFEGRIIEPDDGGNENRVRLREDIYYNSYSAPQVGWWIYSQETGALAQIHSKDGSGWVTLTNRTGTFDDNDYIYATPLSATESIRQIRLYPGHYTYGMPYYLEWLTMHATPAQLAGVDHFFDTGTFDTSVAFADSPANQDNSCGQVDSGGTLLKKRVWTRNQVLREVACQVAQNSYEKVKMGMFRFNGGDGGTWLADLDDLDDGTGVKLQAFKDIAYAIPASGSTPLAESMGDIWRYYKPGSTAFENNDWIGKDYQIVDSAFVADTSPVEHWCQKNYIVLITDGDPTSDTFDNSRWSNNNSIFTSSNVQRTTEYTTWGDWSPADGWGDTDTNGSPYMDDVAYFLLNQDMFPDVHFPDWPGDQNIYTFTIGFAIDKPLLQETALNGNGAYYTATNFAELMDAFDNIITTILLRDFAFSAITAPKKTTTVSNENLNISYVGYFLPSTTESVWNGHLIANELEVRWGFDADDNGEISFDEQYETEALCEVAAQAAGKTCTRILRLSSTAKWDAWLEMDGRTTDRNLYYYDGDGYLDSDIKALTALSTESEATLGTLFGEATTQADATVIENKLYTKVFGDVFHSDISFVGNALIGKKYKSNINPKECLEGDSSKCYSAFYEANKDRAEVVYVGTNDGILHMIDGDPETGGGEIWGFVPDEVLPAVKRIANGTDHEYTVDGRIKAEDIFYRKDTVNEWKTILTFGLRRGGDAFYTLDITDVTTKPKLLWKFKDSVYSGNSFSKPKIVKLRILDTSLTTPAVVEKWVVILTGGFAFNDEDINDPRGKAIFIVDASTGELIWMVGYNKDGEPDDSGTDEIDLLTDSSDDRRKLSSSSLLNYSIPTAIAVIDKNNDGYSDAIYFGNKGGHLFKIDIMNNDTEYWKVYNLYRQTVTTLASSDIEIGGINNTIPATPVLTVADTLSTDYIGHNIIAMNSTQTNYASGVIEEINGTQIKVTLTSANTFQEGQTVYIKNWDPIYLAPTVAFDACYQMWVAFGTGDRDRPRTNPKGGKLVSLLDNGTVNISNSMLKNLSDGASLYQEADDGILWDVVDNDVSKTLYGFYYYFPDTTEKMFDPEPLVLPDEFFIPHIIFNTYQPSTTSTGVQADPCEAPDEGNMKFYDVEIAGCSADEFEIKLKTVAGRISGGGMLGTTYVIYKGSGSVASIPPLQDLPPWEMNDRGNVIFWKEKKR